VLEAFSAPGCGRLPQSSVITMSVPHVLVALNWTWDTIEKITTPLMPGIYEIRVDVEGGALGTSLRFTVLPAVPAWITDPIIGAGGAGLRVTCSNEPKERAVSENTSHHPLEIVGQQTKGSPKCYRVRATDLNQRQLYWVFVEALDLRQNPPPNIPEIP